MMVSRDLLLLDRKELFERYVRQELSLDEYLDEVRPIDEELKKLV